MCDWLVRESKRYKKLSETEGHKPSVWAYRGKFESYSLFAEMLARATKREIEDGYVFYCIDCKDSVAVQEVIDPLAFKVCGDESKYPLCTCCLIKRHIKADNAPSYFR